MEIDFARSLFSTKPSPSSPGASEQERGSPVCSPRFCKSLTRLVSELRFDGNLCDIEQTAYSITDCASSKTTAKQIPKGAVLFRNKITIVACRRALASVRFHAASPALSGRSAVPCALIWRIFLPVLLSVFASAAMAQVSESNPHTDDSSESQDWSYNWSEGWKNRRAKLSAAKYRITHWQLGERSLLTLYGHLNVSQLGFDDGFVNEATVGDNPNSPSRVGITLETEYDSGQNLFWNLEATVPKGRYKSSVSDYLAGGNDAQWDITMLRKAEARLSAPRFGFFSFGQGSMAADGITGLDFSGTAVVASNNVGDSVSGVPARLVDGTTTNSNISSYFPNYDAARRLRLRYDSLSPNGLSWSAAVGREVLTDGNDETYADVALRYETRWRRFGVRSGIGYTYNGSSPGFLSGSVAGLDDNTGLNFAIAMGTSTSGGRYAYGKLGIIRHFFKSGSTAVSADYYASSSPLIDASGSRSWGLAAVQRFDAQDLELYATYRDYAIDGTVRKFADSNAILIGLRFTW